jgi:hypothetical protein
MENGKWKMEKRKEKREREKEMAKKNPPGLFMPGG